MKLSEAGNTILPAYLTLLDKGYKVDRVFCKPIDSITLWRAEKGSFEFHASDPLALLGIVTIAEHRGENWQPKIEELQEFMEKFVGETI